MSNDSDFKEIIRDMSRHGFSQLRSTTHGLLWGFKEFRFSTPHTAAGATQGGHIDQIQDMRARWEKLRAEVLATYPGLKLKVATREAGDKPSVVDVMQPVVNPQDVDVGPRKEDVPPQPPQTVPKEEERPMVKAKRKQTVINKECCGQVFKTKQSYGIHVGRKHGGKFPVDGDDTKVNIDKKIALSSQQSKDGLQKALNLIQEAFTDVSYERDHYKKQMEEMTETFDKMRQAFGALAGPSKVRRKL